MSRQTVTKFIIGILMLSLLAGCKTAEEVPALIEPVAANQSYRPVERRNIGRMNVAVGNVVPKEYCHYYKKVTTLKEIYCNVGDRVEEGDILAIADIKLLNQELQDIADERAYTVSVHDAGLPLYQFRQDMIDIDKRSCVNLEDFKGAAECDNRLNVEKENAVYDELLYEYQLRQYDRRAADLREQIEDGTIRAKTSGYVTYIKDTSKNNVAKINEAIVIIANDEDSYIEVPEQTIDNNLYKKYEVKYALIDGKEIPIEEYEYTSDETIFSKAQDSCPNVRYRITGDAKLTVGDNVVLCFLPKNQTNELCVGNDSVNRDDEGSYVYVKGEGEELEKRYFTAGPSDDYYTTVIDGLEEGEQVLYVQEAASPVRYQEYTVARTDYTQYIETGKLRKAETLNQAYFAPCLGTVEEIKVDTGSKVKKGDVLMVIDSGGGASAIEQVANGKKQAQADYEKTINSLEQTAYDTDAQKQITIIEASMFHMCEPDYLFAMERAQLQQKMAVIERAVAQARYDAQMRMWNHKLARIKEDNDGQGKYLVVAENDGVVSKVFVKKGAVIKDDGTNRLLLSCSQQSPDMVQISVSKSVSLMVNGRTNGLAALGTGVSIIVDGKEEEAKRGVCVSNAWAGKSYAFTEENKAQVCTVNENDNQEGYVVIRMDEKDFTEHVNVNNCRARIDCVKMKNAVVIPTTLVYTEEAKSSGKVKSYVWKVQNGELVKQFIVRGADYGIGDEQNTVVIQGLSEGDVLAQENR